MTKASVVQTETFLSHSADETRRLGETLGRRLKKGDLIFLHGELGAGKTTLVQGLARGLGVQSEVVSPTFVLIVEHQGEHQTLLHLDAYRLENLDEHALSDAGIFDFLERDQAIKIIEWPSRIEEFLPCPRFEISLRRGKNDANEEHRVLDVCENFSQDSKQNGAAKLNLGEGLTR